MGNKSLARHWVRKHFWGLVMLIGLLILSSLAVTHFKKPGQMTVIESQAMDMSAMKPPVGSVPVATEVVSAGPFTAKVRYTGSVAPLTEQNILPRVEGWLTDLKVYNGDRVRAGQLLAVLNSPDIQSKLSEAKYGHIAALRDVPVSQADVARMRAERNASKSEAIAAARDLDGARARVAAAQQMVSEVQKDLKSSQASFNYWKVEFKREGNLLKAGAVSQQEFDSEQSQMIAAEADAETKQAKVQEAQANVRAARAEVNSKQSMVQVARDKVVAANAALSAASDEVSQKAAVANMAGAAQATAATIDDYRQIRTPLDGVVTKRYLSPGVLVNPGTVILTIAQIDKVRLQANVAEQDLGSIKVGAEVVAYAVKGSGRTIRARITSISPSADQTSRTAVVEAIVDNAGHFLVPGDFVSMEIAISSSANAITVPTSALTTQGGRDAVWITRATTKGAKTIYCCPMHPEVVSDKPGICPKCGMPLQKKEVSTGKSAHLVYVKLGASAGDRTEILSGLNSGDDVIIAGNRYLKEGDAVTVTKWGANGPEEMPGAPSGAANMEMPGMGGSGNSMPGMDKSGESTGKPAKQGDMKDMPGM
jgi:multidrug efflux pump subunit AcrA (membrane-fusion protein)